MDIEKLSIDEKIGQRFIFGINGDDIESIIKLIKNKFIGGVILYKKNYRNYNEMLSVIKKIKNANKENKIPLFIAIDQEGGIVNRMPGEIHNLKNIYDVSKSNYDYVSKYANIIGNMLHDSGINMNLAPLLDIYNYSKSKVLVKRCFYGDIKEVTNCGIKYVKELDKNDVISVIKHFPGHGASKMDSHFIIPYIYNYDEILNKHIKPFKEAINKGVPAIMIGHLIIRKLTKMMPSTISDDFIKNYLRNKYDGLIITDEMNMLRRHLLYRFSYLNKVFKTDSDIILVKIKDANEGYKIIDKYKNIIDNNDDYKIMLDSNIGRIIDVKKKYHINDNTDYEGIDIDIINKEIDLLNNKINNGT